MRRRLGFYRQAFGAGFNWMFSLSDWISKLIAVLAFLGIVIGRLVNLLSLPLWAIILIVAILVLVVFAEGAYRVWDTDSQVTATPPPSQPAPVDQHDWAARVDVGDGFLTFVLEHREGNLGAIISLSEYQCEVTDPTGKRTVGSGRVLPPSLITARFPFDFDGAGDPVTGVYRYVWAAKDARGQRHQLAIVTNWHVDMPVVIRQTQFASEGATTGFSVRIVGEEWHSFGHAALILEAKLDITNESKQVKEIRHFKKELSPGDHNAQSLVTAMRDSVGSDLDREVAQLESTRRPWHYRVEPGETVTGWKVLPFPRPVHGGEPGYTITVSDELGHEYGVRRPARPA